MGFEKTFEHSESLLNVALEEFCQHGYEQASINVILEKAGMSKGQFYYHFANKEGLYLALIDHLIARKAAFLSSVMQPEDLQQDIFEILKRQVRYGLAFAREYPLIHCFSERFLQEKGSPIYDKAMAIHDFEENEGLNRLIEQAYANGDFRQDMPLPFIKKTIGYLFTHVTDLTGLTNVDNAEENLNYLIDFMRSGLARKGTASHQTNKEH